uniref:Uncharacterized protein n=1 Tax=Panagrolaimus davidi TaxID=227884 RepID=A0A914PRB1_9BILA
MDSLNFKFLQGSAATNLKVSGNYEEKETLQSWNKNRWKNENTLNTSNKSTLSLHIAAYKNLNESVASDLLDDVCSEGKKKKQKLGSAKSLKQLLYDDFKSQNPFEFPRQQDSNKTQKANIMNFRSSQALMGSSTGRPSELTIKESALSKVSELHALREGDKLSRNSITVQVLSIREGPTWKYLTCAVASDENDKITHRISLKAFSADTKKQFHEINVGDIIRMEQPWKYYERTEEAKRRSALYSNFDFCLKLHSKSSVRVMDAITKNIINCYDKIQSSLKGITISGTVFVAPEKEKNFFLFSVEDCHGKLMEVRMKHDLHLESGDKIQAKGKSSVIDGMLTLDAEEVNVLTDDEQTAGDTTKSDENDPSKK